jgi:hypothetical protein
VESTELLNKRFRQGRVGFEVIQLVGVLKKSDDALETTKRYFGQNQRSTVSFEVIEVTEAYEIDHIDHSGVSGNKQQEGDLDDVQFLDVSGNELNKLNTPQLDVHIYRGMGGCRKRAHTCSTTSLLIRSSLGSESLSSTRLPM